MWQRCWMIMATVVLLAPAQDTSKLTAREIFYGAKPPDPAPKPKAPAAPAAPKKAPKETTVAKAPSGSSTSSNRNETVPVRMAADVATNGAGLAMRYSIVQTMPDGTKKEVPATTKFKTGDRINVRVEVNEFGYLYIFAQGSSGQWSPLFPSPKVANGDNRVGPNHPYVIPDGFAMEFDAKPGEERLFVVFSRKPEPDFDGLIYKVAPERGKDSAPAASEPSRQHPNIILAQNTLIGNDRFNSTKRIYSRDLVIVKVEGDSKSSIGPRFEHAAYVASQNQSDPRVFAEVTLTHQ